MNNVAIFEHPQFGAIRTETDNNEPWFCASDVCRVLSFKQKTESALRALDEDEKLMRKLSALENEKASNRGNWFVNESGLYNLIFRSNKPEAKAFRKWVTSEVLPAIRRTGSYNHSPLHYLVSDNKQLGYDFTNLMLRELLKIESRTDRNRMAGLVDFYVSQIS
jgi:prophage antirepressor-like protein